MSEKKPASRKRASCWRRRTVAAACRNCCDCWTPLRSVAFVRSEGMSQPLTSCSCTKVSMSETAVL
eukprot:4360824-Prymnesium_polylepis.3